MKQRILALATLLLAAAFTAEGQRLVILHTNDSHSQIEPIRVGRDKGLGGVERRAEYIRQVRQQYGKDKVLLLDAGDYNQGTPYFTVAKGDLEIELVNAMGYDVATLGNHEFDNGQEELARRLKKSKFTTLTCNYDFTGTCLEKRVKPWTIVKRGGMKIGIVGATSYLEGNVMKSHLDGMKRLNTIAEVNRWADYLKHKKKCDLVIFLSHLGYQGGTPERPSDMLLVAASRNIDLVIGGHSHTFIKEPAIVKDLDGKDVPIVQAGCQGVEVGKFEIY
ncbi:MAG: metallophosphatase [Bacteroidales bacterium]|nr:metallophosphatase [Bacteroidales bacterium]